MKNNLTAYEKKCQAFLTTAGINVIIIRGEKQSENFQISKKEFWRRQKMVIVLRLLVKFTL